MRFLRKNFTISNFRKAFYTLHIIGIRKTAKRIKTRLKMCQSYAEWYQRNGKVSQSELTRQRNKIFDVLPIISIVVQPTNASEQSLVAMMKSVIAQTYTKWELYIEGCTDRSNTVKQYADKDYRIKYIQNGEQKITIEKMNELLKSSKGDYVAFLDSGDLLTPNALFEFVEKINETDADFLYSDEDKTNAEEIQFFAPSFKPDFSIDYFRSYNYIGHLTIIGQSLLDVAGKYLDVNLNGAQNYDLFLRCIEKTKKIQHISKVLYHKRACETVPEVKMNENGQKALQAHLQRMQLAGKVLAGPVKNTYRIKYSLQEEPLVSIIIPNYNHRTDLQQCLRSIIEKSTYKNYEILVVENNSTDKDIFTYYNAIDNANNIKVLYYYEKFNYSKINNWAVQQAKGKYIVLMNNDIEIITPEWLQEMLMYAQRNDVGAVGVKLLYSDDTIQHGGVILHSLGVAQHAFCKEKAEFPGYQNRNILVQNLSAVTAALMMIQKKVFVKIHGFDEKLEVAYNDVDLCMRIRATGCFVVYNPNIHAYHYESKSRGKDDTLKKRKRAENEIALFYKKWGNNIYDPYYNNNLKMLCFEPFKI